MKEPEFRLDRTAFQKLSFAEADKQIGSSKDIPLSERIRQFNYLMSIAYRFLGEPWPVMDRTVFEMRKHS